MDEDTEASVIVISSDASSPEKVFTPTKRLVCSGPFLNTVAIAVYRAPFDTGTSMFFSGNLPTIVLTGKSRLHFLAPVGKGECLKAG